jgi:hypothetical protein
MTPSTLPPLYPPPPTGIPPYLWAVIVAALVAALGAMGLHLTSAPLPATECECVCEPAPAAEPVGPDLNTDEPLPGAGEA